MIKFLKRNNFKWNNEVEDSFKKLKEAMVTTPVMTLPDFTQHFYLETDASSYYIGAVLMQQGKPISYYTQRAQKIRRIH